jgi:hypothetical protein
VDYHQVYLQALIDGINAQHQPLRAKRWHLRRSQCSCGCPYLPCPVLAAKLAAVDSHLIITGWRRTASALIRVEPPA